MIQFRISKDLDTNIASMIPKVLHELIKLVDLIVLLVLWFRVKHFRGDLLLLTLMLFQTCVTYFEVCLQ